MTSGQGNASPLPRTAYQAYLGRNQGPEFFFSQPFTAGATNIIPKPLSINRPLEAILCRWRGRVVIAGANFTNVAAEAPMTILNRIRIFGTYKNASVAPVDISGATLWTYPLVYGLKSNSVYIGTTRQTAPTSPYAQTLANFGNTGTYDLEIWYLIPTWPIVSEANRANVMAPYFWQPADWNDTLQIQVSFGDQTAFGTPAGMTTTTFSAFGSGAGSPSFDIFTRYVIMGPLRTGFRSSLVIRNEQSSSAVVSAVANNLRLVVLQKQCTPNVLVKSGVNLTGTTAGVQVYASLSDDILDTTQIVVDNKPIRNNLTNRAGKESVGDLFASVPPQGYLPFTFIDSQTPRTAFRADLPTVVGPGSSYELDSNIISANANNLINVVQEQIWHDPDDPYWAATR